MCILLSSENYIIFSMESYKRCEYSHDERVAIIEYIIKNKCYTSLRGNLVWQKMENQTILHRSWQSLKEHFRKKIINILHVFQIPDEDKRLIKEGWESSRLIMKDTNGKKIKRSRFNRYNDIDEAKSKQNCYGISDDSTSSLENEPSKRKTSRKKKPAVENEPRSPSKFNTFSDEEIDTAKQIINDELCEQSSPDLLNGFINNANTTTPTIINNVEKINLPSTSNIQTLNKKQSVNINQQNIEIGSIDIDSDSDETTIRSVSNSDSTTINSLGIIGFSLEEDMSLLNFMRLDKTYLERMHDIKVYQYFHEIYPDSKQPEILQKRFLNNIFPNVCKYSQLTHKEMYRVYVDAGVGIPDNLKLLLKDCELNNSIKSINNRSNNKNVKKGVCDHFINKIGLDYMYCHMVLNNEPHIFVASTNINENDSDILSKKFHIHTDNIHYTNFDSFIVLEQVNKFRKVIYENYGNMISQAIRNKYQNINVEEIISNLELCIQSFSNEDSTDSECETNLEDSICTPDFIPNQKSTPETANNKIPSVIISEKLTCTQNFITNEESTPENRNIKQKIDIINNSECKTIEEESTCTNNSIPNLKSSPENTNNKNPSDILNKTIREESTSTQNFIPNQKSTPENINIKKPPDINNSECESICTQDLNPNKKSTSVILNDSTSKSISEHNKDERNSENKNNSQCFKSIPSEENNVIDTVKQIVHNTSIHSSSEIEIFHTADYFCQ